MRRLQNLYAYTGSREGAVFEGVMAIRITPKTRARYNLTALIPYDEIPYTDGKMTIYVMPRFASKWTQFVFDKFCDNVGLARSWVE